MARFQFVLWQGGGNVSPFLRLASELTRRGHAIDVLGPSELRIDFEGAGAAHTDSGSWMPSADEVVRSAEANGPDVVVIDFMGNETLAGAEATGLPTAALVHTPFRCQSGWRRPVADVDARSGAGDCPDPGAVRAGRCRVAP